MNRRTVLASAGTLFCLAGCVSDDTGDDSEQDPADNATDNGGADGNSGPGSANDTDGNGDDSTDGNNGTSDGGYQVTAGTAVDGPLEHTVTVGHGTFGSPESPLTVTISVMNPTADPVAYADRREVLGRYQRAEGFVLLPVEDDRYEFDKTHGRWTSTERIAQTGEYQIEEIAAGETHSQELALVVEDGTDQQLSATPPRVLTFELSVAASPAADVPPTGPADEWRLSVHESGHSLPRAAQPCPPFETTADRVVCSHTLDPGTAPVALDADPAQRALDGDQPAESVTLTLSNNAERALTFNPHSWTVRRDTGDGWAQLDEQLSGNGTLTLAPGETHTWTLTEAVETIRETASFEAGLYAAQIDVPDPESDGRVACIAFVTLGSDSA
jgi:hypothetical protein